MTETAQQIRERHAQEIRETAAAALKAGQKITIDFLLPTIFVDTGEGEYFFQEWEAENLLEEIKKNPLAEVCTPSEIILYMAQHW